MADSGGRGEGEGGGREREEEEEEEEEEEKEKEEEGRRKRALKETGGRSTDVAALRAAVHDVGRLRRGYGAVGLSSGYGDVGLKGYGAMRL